MKKIKILSIALLAIFSINANAGHHEESSQTAVGVAYSMTVTDPQAVVQAMTAYWNSPTGKKNKGVATLRQVVAGGENPATHTIAVSYPSYEAMDDVMELNANSPDAAAFYQAMSGAATITSRMAFDSSGITSGNAASVTNALPVTAYFMMNVSDPASYVKAWKKVSSSGGGDTASSLFAITADGDLGITHGIAVRANDMATLMSSIKANQSTPEWAEFISEVTPIRSMKRRMITKDLAVFGR